MFKNDLHIFTLIVAVLLSMTIYSLQEVFAENTFIKADTVPVKKDTLSTSIFKKGEIVLSDNAILVTKYGSIADYLFNSKYSPAVGLKNSVGYILDKKKVKEAFSFQDNIFAEGDPKTKGYSYSDLKYRYFDPDFSKLLIEIIKYDYEGEGILKRYYLTANKGLLTEEQPNIYNIINSDKYIVYCPIADSLSHWISTNNIKIYNTNLALLGTIEDIKITVDQFRCNLLGKYLFVFNAGTLDIYDLDANIKKVKVITDVPSSYGIKDKYITYGQHVKKDQKIESIAELDLPDIYLESIDSPIIKKDFLNVHGYSYKGEYYGITSVSPQGASRLHVSDKAGNELYTKAINNYITYMSHFVSDYLVFYELDSKVTNNSAPAKYNTVICEASTGKELFRDFYQYGYDSREFKTINILNNGKKYIVINYNDKDIVIYDTTAFASKTKQTKILTLHSEKQLYTSILKDNTVLLYNDSAAYLIELE